MAVSKQIGAAIMTEINVTHKELIIKGKNPNFPESGFHSLENRSFNIEFSSNNKEDLNNNPISNIKGIAKTKKKQHFIHDALKFSRIIRLDL